MANGVENRDSQQTVNLLLNGTVCMEGKFQKDVTKLELVKYMFQTQFPMGQTLPRGLKINYK